MREGVIIGDAREVLPTLPEDSIDAVITDPPYGHLGISYDSPDVFLEVIPELQRCLKGEGFLAFFAGFPALAEWCVAASKHWKFAEHIVWVKRNILPNYRLGRGHENIIIYRGTRPAFYETKGPYMDVKLPLLATDCISVEALKRRDAALLSGKRDRPSNIVSQPEFKRFNTATDIAPKDMNFSTVWSFLPVNCAVRDGQYRHPAEKPEPIIERLVEMLTPKGATVLDPFAGSGTVSAVCSRKRRRCISIEINPKYARIAQARLEERRDHA